MDIDKCSDCVLTTNINNNYMLKATTYLPPSSNLYQQPHTPTVYRKPLVPCTPNANRRSLRVSFPSNLIGGPTRKSAALKVCNVLIDRYPVTRGAIDSGATDHFLPTTYRGDNHQATSNGMK